MGVLADVRQLADLIARLDVPAPHALHFTYRPTDEAWIRALAADPVIAGKVGLTPRPIVGPSRTVSGVEHIGVRLSWRPAEGVPVDRDQMVAALRVLVDLVAAGEMPPPLTADAMHELRELGGPARAAVCRAALLLGERPTTGQGSTLVQKWLGDASYTVHGFLS